MGMQHNFLEIYWQFEHTLKNVHQPWYRIMYLRSYVLVVPCVSACIGSYGLAVKFFFLVIVFVMAQQFIHSNPRNIF